MKIFLSTLVPFNTMDDANIYSDLARELWRRGHHVTIASPKYSGESTSRLDVFDNYAILRFKTFNAQKASRVAKLRALLSYDSDLNSAIRRTLRDQRYDLALFATPPITLLSSVKEMSRRGAHIYLMLKDIFPQNAIDIKLMMKGGLAHRYYLRMERRLYERCDTIGCMSAANVNYLLSQNSQLDPERVEVLPNAIEPLPLPHRIHDQTLEAESLVLHYGGNLGKPQSISFLIDLIRACRDVPKVHFEIVGSGTDFCKLEIFLRDEQPTNLSLFKQLTKAEYNRRLARADIGLILLDARFSIPNYPSRLLSYLEHAKPVLCLTDNATDVGRDAVEGGFGWWASSADLAQAKASIQSCSELSQEKLQAIGDRGRAYLEDNFHVRLAADRILARVSGLGATVEQIPSRP